jgi:hypothetical protein
LNGISEVVGSIPIGSTIHIHYLPKLSGCTNLDIADLISLNWRRQYPQTCTCRALIVSAQSSSDARPSRPDQLIDMLDQAFGKKLIIRQKATNVLSKAIAATMAAKRESGEHGCHHLKSTYRPPMPSAISRERTQPFLPIS